MILCRVFACQGAALKSSVRDRDSAPDVGRVLGSAVPEIAAEIVAVSAPMGLPTPTDLSTHARGPCWGSAWLVRRGWSGVVGTKSANASYPKRIVGVLVLKSSAC